MSYNSKKSIANMAASILLIVAYVIYALGNSSPLSDDLKSWAVAMLVFIGISVAMTVVIQILFHVAVTIDIAVREKDHDEKEVERMIASSMVEDERDRFINLKSSRIGYIVAGADFVGMLIALAFGISIVPALHIAFGAFFIGSLVEGFASVYFYERGVRNG